MSGGAGGGGGKSLVVMARSLGFILIMMGESSVG